MSWRELQQWRLFDVLHPLPDRLADIHHGILLATIVNLMRSANASPAIPADFFVLRERFDEPEVAPAADGMSEAERLQAVWLMNGGT